MLRLTVVHRIMFMREYNVIDSAVSVDQLRRRLKIEELEQYGEPFTPEFVYDAIRKLPRFASMRVSVCSNHDLFDSCLQQ
jgi:hypothetical protein